MFINVPSSEAEKKKIEEQENAWTGPKFIVLGSVFLGFCLLTLYSLANLTTWMGTHQP